MGLEIKGVGIKLLTIPGEEKIIEIIDDQGVIEKLADRMADSIYEAISRFISNSLEFLLVDLLGKISTLALMAGFLLMVMGSRRFSAKMIKGGGIGVLVSMVAAAGWS